MTGEPRPLPEGTLLLDGATGTELDRRGVDVSLPLWSARALVEAPEVLERIHRDYLEAGADALITNTFRTHRRTLARAGWGERARALTTLAVEIARSAQEAVKPEALVLGSVAPLEDCYRPDLAPPAAVCRAEHEELMVNLLAAGVDLLMIETANTAREALAAAEVAARLAPGRWMICFCTKTDGPPGVLLHGAPLLDVLSQLGDAAAVGVNCVDAAAVLPQVRLLRRVLPPGQRLCAYGNVGHADEAGNWISGEGSDPERYADHAAEWLEAGASIVGGCCGTTPETIAAMAARRAG